MVFCFRISVLWSISYADIIKLLAILVVHPHLIFNKFLEIRGIDLEEVVSQPILDKQPEHCSV